MIRVLSFTVYADGRDNRLHYHSYGDEQVEYASEIRVEQWITYLKEHYTNIFKEPVKIYVTRRSKPDEEIDFMRMVDAAAKVFGFTREEILYEKRTTKFSDARKIICRILMDRDYTAYDIEKILPWKNRIVFNYRTKMNNRIKYEPAFRNYYDNISKEILKEFELFSEDGSGTKIDKI